MNLSPLNCQQLVELVTQYLEDALAAEDRTRFEKHLARCDGCSAYVEQMRQTIQLIGKLSEDEIEPQARQDLLDLFRDWLKKN